MYKMIGTQEEFLESSDIIDFEDLRIIKLVEELRRSSRDKIDFIQRSFEYVRDEVSHSADVNGKVVTCSASEVLKEKQGICYAKSHLLAALLRANMIPCGFCYQRLILDDEKAKYLILHGLNAVYIEELKRWIRIDARGNKEGVNAEFSLDDEKLAFEVREEFGEEDIMIIFSKPDQNVLNKLNQHRTVLEIFADLPNELGAR